MPATISLSSPETKHFTENFFNTLVVAGHKSGFDCRTKMVAVKSSVASAMLRRERVGGGGGGGGGFSVQLVRTQDQWRRVSPPLRLQ